MNDLMKASELWELYQYAKDKGHDDYCKKAKRLEQFYLGAGEQYTPEDAAYLDKSGRPTYELNDIQPGVNKAISYQLNNRSDIAYRPAGGRSDNALATVHTKVVKNVLSNNNYEFLENLMFQDGVIQQRGYLNVTMDFDENPEQGDIKIEVPDPYDVIPDPDAKSYDPKDWSFCINTKWLTKYEIMANYGEAKWREVEKNDDPSPDFGTDDNETQRNTFSTSAKRNTYFGDYLCKDHIGTKRYRIIDVQRNVRERTDVLVFSGGEVRKSKGLSPNAIQEYINQGAIPAKIMMNKVLWTVSTKNVVLFDEESPFDTFTTILYSPIFRRGKTQGLVDNAIDPQEMRNKAISSFMHVLNSSANGGWITEEGSIVNMDEESFKENGSKTGLHVVIKKGATAPQKITPNQIPQGFETAFQIASTALKDSILQDVSMGINSDEVSSLAIKAKNRIAKQQLDMALFNLKYTRRILGRKLLELIQKFYDGERVIRITELDRLGKPVESTLVVNKERPDGSIENDLTIGKFDVVTSETQNRDVTDDTEFNKIMEMKQYGINFPDKHAILASNIESKYEIVEEMEAASANAQPDPMQETQIEVMKSGIEKVKAEIEGIRAKTFDTNATGLFKSIQTGLGILQDATVSKIADEVAKSSGFVDLNGSPTFMTAPGAAILSNGPTAPVVQTGPINNPMSPPPPLNPGPPSTGMNGIETLQK